VAVGWPGTSPDQDVQRLEEELERTVERLGLLAFSFDLGPSVIDGGYVRLGDIGVALVNGTTDAGRRRFDLAHELGHHLLADEYTADFGLGTTPADREALINAFAIQRRPDRRIAAEDRDHRRPASPLRDADRSLGS
jgi:Zn-dependent peptidase ImmA (M78 family)